MNDLKVPFVAKTTFLIEGFAALIAWNSILTAFDFLHISYPDYDVAFTLTIPIFIGQTSFALLVYKISQMTSLNARIVSSLCLMSFVLVILPLIATYIHGENGFWVCAILMLIIGLGNSLMQSSGIALVSLFPPQCIIYFFTGTGLAGILVGVLRVIILKIFGDTDHGIIIGTIIYFTISGVFLLLTIFVHFAFRRTLFCKFYIKKARSKTLLHQEEIVEDIVLGPININKEIQKEINQNHTLEEMLLKNFYEVDLMPYVDRPMVKCSYSSSFESNKPLLQIETKNIEMEILKRRGMDRKLSEDELINNFFLDASAIALRPHDEKNTFRFVFNVFKKIHPYPLLCWLIFVQTFLMFPGVSLKKTLSGISFSLGSTLLILVFNIFDTMGKYVADALPKPSPRGLIMIITFRFLMFPLFLLMIDRWRTPVISEDWFAILNMGLFAITHGFVVSNLMIGAPNLASDKEKETAGFIMGLPLTTGIVTGSLLAMSFTGL